jgi:hypothetical protein
MCQTSFQIQTTRNTNILKERGFPKEKKYECDIKKLKYFTFSFSPALSAFLWKKMNTIKSLTQTIIMHIHALKMEAVCSSERLVSTYRFTQHYNPEDQH